MGDTEGKTPNDDDVRIEKKHEYRQSDFVLGEEVASSKYWKLYLAEEAQPDGDGEDSSCLCIREFKGSSSIIQIVKAYLDYHPNHDIYLNKIDGYYVYEDTIAIVYSFDYQFTEPLKLIVSQSDKSGLQEKDIITDVFDGLDNLSSLFKLFSFKFSIESVFLKPKNELYNDDVQTIFIDPFVMLDFKEEIDSKLISRQYGFFVAQIYDGSFLERSDEDESISNEELLKNIPDNFVVLVNSCFSDQRPSLKELKEFFLSGIVQLKPKPPKPQKNGMIPKLPKRKGKKQYDKDASKRVKDLCELDRPLKVVFCGDGSVGKTCILVVLTRNNFPEEYVPTVFDNHNYAVKHNVGDEEVDVNLFLCDTAGQEDYGMMRRLVYNEVDVFVLCFSLVERYTFNNVGTNWVKEIKEFQEENGRKNIPVVLVGTKKDLAPESKDFVKREEVLKLCEITKILDSYVETSAKEKLGLGELAKIVVDKWLDSRV